MKNVELTDQSSERQADDIDIHRTLFMGLDKMKIDHICLLNIFLMYTFELI